MRHLQSLPESIGTALKHLEHLHISECDNLLTLPRSLAELTSLRTLCFGPSHDGLLSRRGAWNLHCPPNLKVLKLIPCCSDCIKPGLLFMSLEYVLPGLHSCDRLQVLSIRSVRLNELHLPLVNLVDLRWLRLNARAVV